MIVVRTAFTPFRLRIARREPIQLSIQIENNSNIKKTIDLEVSLHRSLSFEKTGYKTTDKQTIELGPNSVKQLYYDIWAKPNIEAGEVPIGIKITEYEGANREYVVAERQHEISLTAVE